MAIGLKPLIGGLAFNVADGVDKDNALLHVALNQAAEKREWVRGLNHLNIRISTQIETLIPRSTLLSSKDDCSAAKYVSTLHRQTLSSKMNNRSEPILT